AEAGRVRPGPFVQELVRRVQLPVAQGFGVARGRALRPGGGGARTHQRRRDPGQRSAELPGIATEKRKVQAADDSKGPGPPKFTALDRRSARARLPSQPTETTGQTAAPGPPTGGAGAR